MGRRFASEGSPACASGGGSHRTATLGSRAASAPMGRLLGAERGSRGRPRATARLPCRSSEADSAPRSSLRPARMADPKGRTHGNTGGRGGSRVHARRLCAPRSVGRAYGQTAPERRKEERIQDCQRPRCAPSGHAASCSGSGSLPTVRPLARQFLTIRRPVAACHGTFPVGWSRRVIVLRVMCFRPGSRHAHARVSTPDGVGRRGNPGTGARSRQMSPEKERGPTRAAPARRLRPAPCRSRRPRSDPWRASAGSCPGLLAGRRCGPRGRPWEPRRLRRRR